MSLRDLKRSMTDEAWAEFAAKCGTTAGHLSNVAYGTATANAAVSRQVHDRSGGKVMAWQLRPDDWFRIWPDLRKSKGAPKVPEGQGV